MDEKDFKKHLRDLVHGHHHPAEHDWQGDSGRTEPAKQRTKGVKRASRKNKAK